MVLVHGLGANSGVWDKMLPYLKAEAARACPVEFLGPELLGQIHDPLYVLAKIREMLP